MVDINQLFEGAVKDYTSKTFLSGSLRNYQSVLMPALAIPHNDRYMDGLMFKAHSAINHPVIFIYPDVDTVTPKTVTWRVCRKAQKRDSFISILDLTIEPLVDSLYYAWTLYNLRTPAQLSRTEAELFFELRCEDVLRAIEADPRLLRLYQAPDTSYRNKLIATKVAAHSRQAVRDFYTGIADTFYKKTAKKGPKPLTRKQRADIKLQTDIINKVTKRLPLHYEAVNLLCAIKGKPIPYFDFFNPLCHEAPADYEELRVLKSAGLYDKLRDKYNLALTEN